MHQTMTTETLKDIRSASGKTLRSVAQGAGVWERQVRDIERGKVTPGLDVADKLARALGIDMDAFLAAYKLSRNEFRAKAKEVESPVSEPPAARKNGRSQQGGA